jgi:hypothetical protein
MGHGDGTSFASRVERAYKAYAETRWGRLALLALLFGAFAVTNGATTLLVELLLAVVLVDAYVGRQLRRREPLNPLGLDVDVAARYFLIGAAAATTIMSVSVAVLAIAGWYRVDDIHFDVVGIGYYVAFFLAVAVAEEVLSRGMIWRLIERRAGTLAALLGSSLVFGLGHFLNPSATLWSGIAIALHAGLMFGAMFIITRSLWVPIGAHFAWNFVEGPVFGTEVSGMDTDVLIEATTRGPEIWTGGAFGPEAGLVTVLLGTLPAIALLIYARRRGKFEIARPETTSQEPTEPGPPTSPDPHVPERG